MMKTNTTGFNIVYTLNTWIKPSIGKIFAFDSLKSALKYTEDISGYKIFEAECEGYEMCIRPIVGVTISPDIYRKYWQGDFKNVPLMGAPEGTVLVDKIKLMEEVKI